MPDPFNYPAYSHNQRLENFVPGYGGFVPDKMLRDPRYNGDPQIDRIRHIQGIPRPERRPGRHDPYGQAPPMPEEHRNPHPDYQEGDEDYHKGEEQSAQSVHGSRHGASARRGGRLPHGYSHSGFDIDGRPIRPLGPRDNRYEGGAQGPWYDRNDGLGPRPLPPNADHPFYHDRHRNKHGPRAPPGMAPPAEVALPGGILPGHPNFRGPEHSIGYDYVALPTQQGLRYYPTRRQ